jgi:nucleoid DNA-binding protein
MSNTKSTMIAEIHVQTGLSKTKSTQASDTTLENIKRILADGE